MACKTSLSKIKIKEEPLEEEDKVINMEENMLNVRIKEEPIENNGEETTTENTNPVDEQNLGVDEHEINERNPEENGENADDENFADKVDNLDETTWADDENLNEEEPVDDENLNEEVQDDEENLNEEVQDDEDNLNEDIQDDEKNLNEEIQDDEDNLNEEVQDDEENLNEEVQDDEGNIEDGDEFVDLDEIDEEILDDENEEEKQSKKVEDSKKDANLEDAKIEEVLKSKIKLSDGNEHFIFSRGPKYADDLWPINCHLCRMGNMFKHEQVIAHISGRRHKKNLEYGPPDPQKYLEPFRQTSCHWNPRINKPIKILPGEFITDIKPEYEDRLIKDRVIKGDFPFKAPPKKELVNLLNKEPMYDYNKKAPIMGLSYGFKMMKFKRISHFCALCSIELHGDAYQHYVGAPHQGEYVIRHFKKLREKISSSLDEIKSPYVKHKYIRNIFRVIYRKIELKKGFRKLNIVEGYDFRNNRSKYISKCRKLQHYDEKTIKISDSEIDELVAKTLKGETIIKPDPISLSNPKVGLRDDGVSHKKPDRRENLKRKRSISPIRRANRNDLPPKIRRDGRIFRDTPQEWDRYRRMLGAVLDDLDEVYDKYKRFPEDHPLYDAEWKQFWHRRCKKLERDNIDPKNYDFNTEWISFWSRRLKEIHSKEISKRKKDIKTTLRLPFDKRSPSPIRKRRRSPTPVKSRRRHLNERYSPEPRSIHHHRSHQQMDNDRSNGLQTDEPLSIISILRLLTALEDLLGSLGPKAVQLLAGAVIFEKKNSNANDLMMDNDYYVFFMIVQEKLKGQLQANIIETKKIRAVKKAISDLTTMIALFEENFSKKSTKTNMSGIPSLLNSSILSEDMSNAGVTSALYTNTKNNYDYSNIKKNNNNNNFNANVSRGSTNYFNTDNYSGSNERNQERNYAVGYLDRLKEISRGTEISHGIRPLLTNSSRGGGDYNNNNSNRTRYQSNYNQSYPSIIDNRYNNYNN